MSMSQERVEPRNSVVSEVGLSVRFDKCQKLAEWIGESKVWPAYLESIAQVLQTYKRVCSSKKDSRGLAGWE